MFVHTSNSLGCRPGSTVPNTHTVESLFLCSPLHYPTHPFCKFLIRNSWHCGLRPNHVHNSVRRPEHVPAAISAQCLSCRQSLRWLLGIFRTCDRKTYSPSPSTPHDELAALD